MGFRSVTLTQKRIRMQCRIAGSFMNSKSDLSHGASKFSAFAGGLVVRVEGKGGRSIIE